MFIFVFKERMEGRVGEGGGEGEEARRSLKECACVVVLERERVVGRRWVRGGDVELCFVRFYFLYFLIEPRIKKGRRREDG